MADITSANSVFILTIPLLFPVPQRLQGYSADDAFSTDATTLSESVMGVDGRKSAGYTPAIVPQTITFQADSPSIAIFEALVQYMKLQRACPSLLGLIRMPSIGKEFVLTNGSLKTAVQIPNAKKVLQPVAYGIEWESIDWARI